MGYSIEDYYTILKLDGYLAKEIKDSGIITAPLLGSIFIKSLLEYKLRIRGDFSVRKYKEQLDISSINTCDEDIARVIVELHLEQYIRKINCSYIDEVDL